VSRARAARPGTQGPRDEPRPRYTSRRASPSNARAAVWHGHQHERQRRSAPSPTRPGLARFRHINLINPGGPGLIWVGEHTECAASHCWVTIKHPQGLAAGFKVPSEELLPAGPMEHRGVRYEIKVGIERNHFVWIIYTSPRSRQGSIRGTRQAAVSAAERAISAWWRRQHGHQAARVQRD
jgi:hypothetical protein